MSSEARQDEADRLKPTATAVRDVSSAHLELTDKPDCPAGRQDFNPGLSNLHSQIRNSPNTTATFSFYISIVLPINTGQTCQIFLFRM